MAGVPTAPSIPPRSSSPGRDQVSKLVREGSLRELMAMVDGPDLGSDSRTARPPVIDEDLFEEMYEAFAFCDGDRDGKVTTAEFGTIVRSLGYGPTEDELRTLTRAIDRSAGGTLDFPTFVELFANNVVPRMRRHAKHVDSVRKGFTTFLKTCRSTEPVAAQADLDGKARTPTEKISARDLERLMTETGDRLDAYAFSYMFRVAPPDEDGMVDWSAIVSAMEKGAKR